jgi:hypothetical protein
MTDMTTTIHLPPRLAEQTQNYVKEGWFPDLNSLMVEALRRYMETHPAELNERFVLEDVEWGLHGNE